MFECFKKQKEQETETVQRPTIDLPSFLAIQVAEYYKQNQATLESDISELVDEVAVLNRAYNELEGLGLINSKNAKAIEEKLNEKREVINNFNKAKGLVNDIKIIQEAFGPNTFLMSKAKFWEMLKKYNLSIGLLTEYTGVIPAENILEISNAKNVITKKLDTYYSIRINRNLRKVTEIRYDSWDKENCGKELAALKKYLEDSKGLALLNGYGISSRDMVGFDSGRLRVVLDGRSLDRRNFLIACPENQLKPQEVVFTQRAIDPIVFQMFGDCVIIYTMWGEKSEDEVFKKYKELNNLTL